MESPSICQVALGWVNEEIRRLRIAPKINGCKMTEEWKTELEIMEYLQKVLKEREEN